MGRNVPLWLVIALTLICTVPLKAQYNDEVEAKIDLVSNSDFIEIVGSAYNRTNLNQSLRYVLSTFKNDDKGNNLSKNQQSGRLVLEPGQKSNLSSTTINANDKDRIIILLLVYNEKDELKGKDRIVINGTEEDKKEAELLEEQRKKVSSLDTKHEDDDGILLRGVVLEDTKTKPGRDFYSMFYSDYLFYNINGKKIVTIKEVLSIANNTKIEVYVGETKVIEFIVRPNNDFLKNMAFESIKRVNGYLNSLEKGENIIKSY